MNLIRRFFLVGLPGTLKCFLNASGFSGVHSEINCIDSRRIGTQMYRKATPLFWLSSVESSDLREKQ